LCSTKCAKRSKNLSPPKTVATDEESEDHLLDYQSLPLLSGRSSLALHRMNEKFIAVFLGRKRMHEAGKELARTTFR
jgi:hypothetical protein